MRKAISGVAVLALAVTLVLVVAPAEAATRYSVSVLASATRADVGRSIVLRGAVSPNAKGQRVLVQRRVGTTWVTVTGPLLNRKSRYAATVRVTAGGTNLFRVVKKRSNGHPTGVSRTVAVTGWRWRNLNTLPLYLPSSNATVLASGTLGPDAFPSTYRPFIKLGNPAGDYGAITVRLDKKCTVFEGVVGVTPDTVLSTVHVANAGVVLTEGGQAQQFLGTGMQRNQDPIHVVRSGAMVAQAVALNLGADIKSANSYIGWGAAKVYCAS